MRQFLIIVVVIIVVLLLMTVMSKQAQAQEALIKQQKAKDDYNIEEDEQMQLALLIAALRWRQAKQYAREKGKTKFKDWTAAIFKINDAIAKLIPVSSAFAYLGDALYGGSSAMSKQIECWIKPESCE